MSKQDNFQAKHRAMKQINFSHSQTENSKPYLEGFYNPFNAFLGLCNKRELAFLIQTVQVETDQICKENTKHQIGEAILIQMQFKNNSCKDQQIWFKSLDTRCFLICENGHGIKI